MLRCWFPNVPFFGLDAVRSVSIQVKWLGCISSFLKHQSDDEHIHLKETVFKGTGPVSTGRKEFLIEALGCGL